MITFYNNLPWPIYLLVSIVLGVFLIQYFLRNSKKYTLTVSIGMILISCSAILAGVVRIFHLLDLNWHLKLIELLPFPGIIFGVPLVCVGAYLKTKNDPKNRKQALIGIMIVSLCLLLLGIVLIFF
jgi:hypothetical protein